MREGDWTGDRWVILGREGEKEEKGKMEFFSKGQRKEGRGKEVGVDRLGKSKRK